MGPRQRCRGPVYCVFEDFNTVNHPRLCLSRGMPARKVGRRAAADPISKPRHPEGCGLVDIWREIDRRLVRAFRP